MDTPNLAALVSGLMGRHPACRWTILSGRTPEEDLVIELHLVAQPERVATVRVNAVAEVFSFAFAGHNSHVFACEGETRPELVRERIDGYLSQDCLADSTYRFQYQEQIADQQRPTC